MTSDTSPPPLGLRLLRHLQGLGARLGLKGPTFEDSRTMAQSLLRRLSPFFKEIPRKSPAAVPLAGSPHMS